MHIHEARQCRRQVLAALLILSGCESGPTAPTFLTIEITGGDDQIGSAGATLPEPLSVRVTDDSGRPASGVWIGWSSVGGTPSAARSSTDAAGLTSVRLTLDTAAGVRTTVAELEDAVVSNARARAVFTSVALVQGAARISPNYGEDGVGQTDTVLANLPMPFKVLVQDHRDEPVAGVVVEWSTDGEGSLSSTASTTDASGIAMVGFALGPHAGRDSVSASVPGLIGSPVKLYATATPGPARHLELVGGDERLGTVNSGIAYAVRLTDDHDNGVPGQEVSWVAGSGYSFVHPAQSTTDSTGVATATHALGPFDGAQTGTAWTDELPGPLSVTFTSIAVSAVVQVVSGWECHDYCYYYYGSTDPFFTPTSTLVKVGRTVGWSWDGIQEHDVVFEDDPTQPVSSSVQRTGRHLRTFLAPGTYRYRCTLHSTDFTQGMVGEVIVYP